MTSIVLTPVWIEVRNSKGVLQSRQQFSAAPILIGRGPICQVLIDDPFVAPVHAQVLFSDQGISLESLPSVNGLQQQGRKIERLQIQPSQAEPSGQTHTVSMGKSTITIRTANESVSPERPLSDSREIAATSLGWKPIIGMLTLMFSIEFFGVWSGMVREAKLTDFLTPVLTLGGFVLVWSLSWALLNRVFGGVVNFRQHVFVASAAVLVSSLLNEVLDVLGYGLALRHVGSIDSVMRYVAAAVASYYHLKIISSENMKFKGLALSAAVFGLLAVLGVTQFDRFKRALGTQLYAGSKAPGFQLKPSQPLDSIMQNFDKTQAVIEKQRTEKLGEGSDFDFMDD